MSKWDPEHSEKYLGSSEDWDRVENAMRTILDEIGLEYTEAAGEAAFYGPKLDIQAKNVYGKEDTMITIQLDMFLAERYDMYYIDANGEKKRFDVSPYIGKGIFAPLSDETFFRKVRVFLGSIQWPNGADLCPDTLYLDSMPV